jgi:hypothetical protein
MASLQFPVDVDARAAAAQLAGDARRPCSIAELALPTVACCLPVDRN